MDSFECGEGSVSVTMEGVKSSDGAKQVSQLDIKARWDKLHKKPGYEM